MRIYETIFITRTDVVDDKLNQLKTRIKGLIKKLDGLYLELEEWGKKKFSYEIEKSFKGNYFLLKFAGAGNIVGEIERNFKIFDDILRWHTMLIERNVKREELEEKYKILSSEEENTKSEQPKINPKNQQETTSETQNVAE